MKRGELSAAIRSKLGDRSEMSFAEAFSVIYLAYGETELMRKACMCERTPAVNAYVAGDQITDAQRASLVRAGITRVVCDVLKKYAWLEVDRKQGVVRRVRS